MDGTICGASVSAYLRESKKKIKGGMKSDSKENGLVMKAVLGSCGSKPGIVVNIKKM